MKFLQIRPLILSLVCALWCTPGDTMAEPCLEIEGVNHELFMGAKVHSYKFKVSLGKSGFELTLQAVGEPGPRIIMGGEDGFVGTIVRFPDQTSGSGYASTASDVPQAGPGAGGVLYALFGNYSKSIKSDAQIDLIQMMAQLHRYDTKPTVRQTWQFDSVFPFGATNMTAYVFPDANYPKNLAAQFYPNGWKIGEMKVIQRDTETTIPILAEATWFDFPRSVSQKQSPDQVEPWVIERIEVTHIAQGQRASYLPEIKTKPIYVIDQRGKLPNGEFSRYYLKPGDLWPRSNGPEFARRQSEALELWKAEQKAGRNPIWPTATLLVGSGVILAFVIRLSRQRPEQITPQ